MIRVLSTAGRFFWRAAAGYRLRPWRSPYLRWRVETYTGKPAESLRAFDFLQLLYDERKQVSHFFRWLFGIRRLATAAPR